MKELNYANKMLRKVKNWKNGKQTLVDSGSQAKNMKGFKMSARDVWGDPNAKISTGKPAS